MGHPESGADVGELISRYARLIRSAVTRVAGAAAPEIADDIEQRVALSLLRRAKDEQAIRHPASYLYRAAVRETVRVVREERRRQQQAPATDDLYPGGPASPERLYELKEMGMRITEALGTLQPRRRRAVRAHLAGFSVREIMEMYEWSYNTARNLIARGMADLRAELRRRGIHD